jgi:ribonuclease III
LLKKLAGYFSSDPRTVSFKKSISGILGFKPKSYDIYILAISHTSSAKVSENGFREHNERLEYLGDSVLGLVVAEYLFKKYPFKDEGFLTEIRSRIVNGDSLSTIAIKMGLSELVKYEGSKTNSKSIYGDALEALIAAIFLDTNFKTCKKFIINKIIEQHIDLDEILETNKNYKSKLIEWAHKEEKILRFEIVNEVLEGSKRRFEAAVVMNDEKVATGYGFSKKKAEQDAAMKLCDLLKIDS